MDQIIQSCAINTVFICHSCLNKDGRGQVQRAKGPSGGWRGAEGRAEFTTLSHERPPSSPRSGPLAPPPLATPAPGAPGPCSPAVFTVASESPAKPVAPGAQPVLPGCSRVIPPTLSPGRAPLSWEVTRSWEKVGPSTGTTFYMGRLGGFLWGAWGGPANVGC